MKVLITGASGFVGIHLAQELLKQGHQVRALVRAASNTSELEGLGLELARGSYQDAESLKAAVDGVDAVVHAAGGGKVRSVKDFYQANTETTRALLDACQEPLHFLLVSSLSAHGPSLDGQPQSESGAPHPVSHYGKSKREAEKLVLAAQDRLRVSILRPPAIYGPKDTRMLGLFKSVQRGLAPSIGSTGTTSVIYIDDCVSALMCLLTGEQESGAIYFVEDGQRHTKTELIDSIAVALGKKPLVLPLPKKLLETIAVGAETYGKLTKKAVVLTRDKVADLTQDHWLCSADKLRSEHQWQAEIDLQEGMKRTAAAYQQLGWL